MGFVTQPFGLGNGQNALIDLRGDRGRVWPGQSRCRLTAGLPVYVEPEPDPESPDPGDDHSSGTVVGLGSCRLAEV